MDALIAHWLATHHQYSVNEGDALVLRTATDADEYRAAGWKVEGPFVLQDDGGAVEALREIVHRAETPCAPHEPPLPYDVAWAEQVAIAKAALDQLGGQ